MLETARCRFLASGGTSAHYHAENVFPVHQAELVYVHTIDPNAPGIPFVNEQHASAPRFQITGSQTHYILQRGLGDETVEWGSLQKIYHVRVA